MIISRRDWRFSEIHFFDPLGVQKHRILAENQFQAIFRNRQGLESWNLAQMMFMWPYKSLLNDFSKTAIFTPLGVQKLRNFSPKMLNLTENFLSEAIFRNR